MTLLRFIFVSVPFWGRFITIPASLSFIVFNSSLYYIPQGGNSRLQPSIATCNRPQTTKARRVLPACNAERSTNRNFPCEVQCRVEAVFGTCVQCRTLGKQEFSLRSAMQGGSCFLYLHAMPNARQTGIFPAECNAGWELLTAVIEGACLPLACLLLYPQVQVERPLRFREMFLDDLFQVFYFR